MHDEVQKKYQIGFQSLQKSEIFGHICGFISAAKKWKRFRPILANGFCLGVIASLRYVHSYRKASIRLRQISGQIAPPLYLIRFEPEGR